MILTLLCTAKNKDVQKPQGAQAPCGFYGSRAGEGQSLHGSTRFLAVFRYVYPIIIVLSLTVKRYF